MTHDPGKEDLAEKQLSQLYHALDAPEASNLTDDAILAFARQRTMTPDEEPNKPVINWKGGFSVAASIVLVSVLYWAQLTPENFSATDSSDLDLPDLTTEQGVMTTPQDMASGLGLQEQKTMVTAARVASPAKATSMDTLTVSTLSGVSRPAKAPETISEGVVTTPNLESTAMTNEEQSGRLIKTGDSVSDRPDGTLEHHSLDNRLSDLSETKSSILPDCNLSLHGGYKLVSTPLAKYTVSWNDSDKVWLIKMLNDEIDFSDVTKLSSEGLSEEGVAILNKPNFADSYYKVVEQLQRCRENFGRAIQ